MATRTNLYNCTQEQLYIITDLAWSNYGFYQADFQKFKGKYTIKFGTDALAELAAAQIIDDDQTRNAPSEQLRIELLPIADNCLSNWQFLKSYIQEIYPGKTAKPMLEAAGSKMYKKAANYGWEQLKNLLANADKFITNNATTLENNGNNMPTTFPAKFTADKAAFDTKYATYLKTSLKKPGGTNAKLTANNAVYTKLIDMLADGKLIYKNDDVKRPLFTFKELLSYITTAGDTGIHLKVVDASTGLPINGYTATFNPGSKSATGSPEGIAEVKLTEATYSVQVVCPGYKDTTATGIEVKTGIMKRVLIVLSK